MQHEEDTPETRGPAAVRSIPHTWALCTVVPVLFLCIAYTLLAAKGPYWLGSNLDPDYPYLLNGLLLAVGETPGLTGHPGTSTQILLGAVLRATHPASSFAQITMAVLKEPEHHLRLLQHVLLGMVALSLLAAGLLTHKLTGRLTSALLVQLTPLVSPTLLRDVLCVKPEPLLIISGLMCGALALKAASPQRPRTLALPVGMGALCAFAAISKITALPLCVLGASLPDKRTRRVFAAAFAGAAGLFLLPAWPRLGDFWSLMRDIATGPGRYGHGPTAPPGALLGLMWETPAFLPVLILSLVAAVVSLRPGACGHTRIPLGAVRCLAAALALQLILVAPHPYEARYLLPAHALVGAALVAALDVLLPPGVGTAGRRVRRAIDVALPAALVLGMLATASVTHARLTASAQALRNVEAFVSRHRTTPVIGFYRASTPEFALYFGNSWAASRFGLALEALHPGNVFFNVWTSRFESFAETIPSAQSITSHGFLLRGAPVGLLPFLSGRPDFRRPVLDGPLDALYAAGVSDKVVLPFGDFVATGLHPPITLVSPEEQVVVRAVGLNPVVLRYRGNGPAALVGRVLDLGAPLPGLHLSVDGGPAQPITFAPRSSARSFSAPLPSSPGVHELMLLLEPAQSPAARTAPVLLLRSLQIVPARAGADAPGTASAMRRPLDRLPERE